MSVARALPRALVAGLCALAATGSPAAQDRVATLDDVAWIAGQWSGDADGARSEEVWVPPQGDSMLGMWRLVVGGQARVFELLAITQEPSGPVLRLRHFSRTLVAREEKDAAIALPLVSWGAGRAVFEGQGSKGTLRLSYHAPAQDRLEVVLEHGPQRDTFTFRRAATLVR